MPVFVLLQIPPLTVFVNTVVAPGQAVAAPAIVPGFGEALTVTDFVAVVEPQPFVTV
jgi:hypothetical protein